MLARLPVGSRLLYVDHIDGSGTAPFQLLSKLDLEGIVAKHKHGPYKTVRAANVSRFAIASIHSWARREELFERERRTESIAVWHSCVTACAELEEAFKAV